LLLYFFSSYISSTCSISFCRFLSPETLRTPFDSPSELFRALFCSIRPKDHSFFCLSLSNFRPSAYIPLRLPAYCCAPSFFKITISYWNAQNRSLRVRAHHNSIPYGLAFIFFFSLRFLPYFPVGQITYLVCPKAACWTILATYPPRPFSSFVVLFSRVFPSVFPVVPPH